MLQSKTDVLNWYEVKRISTGAVICIQAKSGDTAKRRACHMYGVKVSDYWCGITNYSVRKLTSKEIAAKGLEVDNQ